MGGGTLAGRFLGYKYNVWSDISSLRFELLKRRIGGVGFFFWPVSKRRFFYDS